MSLHHYDFVGLIGIALIVGCYFFLQTGKLQSEDLGYSAFNGMGAMCILYSIAFAFNLSAFLVEAFWVTISVIGIVRYFLRRRNNTEHIESQA